MDNVKLTKLSYIKTIPIILDEGFLCFAESQNHIPFHIKRFYYIFDVKSGAIRGEHAHKDTQQMLFCLRGSITVVLDNGVEREELVLDQPNRGIFLDKMIWHDMKNFTKETLLLVIASDYYQASDYIRNYDTFLALVEKPRPGAYPPAIATRPLTTAKGIPKVVSQLISQKTMKSSVK